MHSARQLSLAALMAVVAFIFLIPIIWAVLTSLKEPVDAFSVPPTVFFQPTLRHHREIWLEREFWNFLLNSIIVSVSVVVISVPIGTMAAFALSRTRSRGGRLVLLSVLAIRMFPYMLLAVPFFILASKMNMHGSYVSLILALVAINQPFTIWLMKSFCADIPKELDEAAMIDGCTTWQTLWLVIIPLLRPGIFVTSLFSLLLAYNEFLFALVLTSPATKTLPVAIAEFGAEDIAYWSLSAAAAIGIMLPVVVFMLLMQKHLVRGLTFGAVKG